MYMLTDLVKNGIPMIDFWKKINDLEHFVQQHSINPGVFVRAKTGQKYFSQMMEKAKQ